MKTAGFHGWIFMPKVFLRILFFLNMMFFLCISQPVLGSEAPKIPWKKAPIDLTDLPSLQRGFKTFMNHCSGCHGLKFARYATVAEDIGIVDASGKILTDAVKNNLMFVGDKITDNIHTAMRKEDGAHWFGIAPPDLSVVTRSRGADWVYNYLANFYVDDKKQWGVNNKVYPDVAMPDVLASLRASMKPEEFDKTLQDLVNFLVYVGEPTQRKRQYVGVWVLIFLCIFTVFAVLLKREYWKDVK